MDIEFILLIPVLLLSLSFHEYMHGRISYNLGDPTPKVMGRLTMNPLAHLDLIGSLVLIVTRRIGWAKPVPINPRYYRNPRKGMMYVGLAGPGANIFLAVSFSIILRFYAAYFDLEFIANSIRYTVGTSDLILIIAQFLMLAIQINLVLALFNLLPFPPLDGSKILMGFLPAKFDLYFNKLEGGSGMFIIMILAFTGILWRIILPPVNFFMNILI